MLATNVSKYNVQKCQMEGIAVVVRPLSVCPFRRPSRRRRPSSVRPSCRPSKYYLQTTSVS
jgi:hypothetical protein